MQITCLHQCLFYLYALKHQYSKRITLSRGNRKDRHLTGHFTWRDCELCRGHRAIRCLPSFCALPVAALVDNRFFCVHGGVLPELVTWEDLHRAKPIPRARVERLIMRLLWSDPMINLKYEHEHS
ncbi:Metallo-dependent phosphatase [Rhizopogon salebrosus TDB-379]|nr:Metallo-dependent phosphatase [Rhizopogon salebrosus TDB-379]